MLPVAGILKRKSKSNPDTTYGELLPAFLSKIFDDTGLSQNSLYLDLGSGIGNTVLQAAIESGCEATGIEYNRTTHKIALGHRRRFLLRRELTDVKCGSTKLVQGDFLASPIADRLVSRADVIIVNNYMFTQETDDRLYEKLLHLMKRGARAVSTKTLQPMGRRRGELEGFTMRQLRYDEDSVSWSPTAGPYWIAQKV